MQLTMQYWNTISYTHALCSLLTRLAKPKPVAIISRHVISKWRKDLRGDWLFGLKKLYPTEVTHRVLLHPLRFRSFWMLKWTKKLVLGWSMDDDLDDLVCFHCFCCNSTNSRNSYNSKLYKDGSYLQFMLLFLFHMPVYRLHNFF